MLSFNKNQQLVNNLFEIRINQKSLPTEAITHKPPSGHSYSLHKQNCHQHRQPLGHYRGENVLHPDFYLAIVIC